MDENIVRAIGAILSRRGKEELRGIFVGLAIAKEFVHERAGKEFFESGVVATDRELSLHPGHEDDEIEAVTRYAEMIRDSAVEYLRVKKLADTLQKVAELFGPEMALELAKKSGAAVVMEGGEGDPAETPLTGLPREAIEQFMAENCRECEKEECSAHPSNDDDDDAVASDYDTKRPVH